MTRIGFAYNQKPEAVAGLSGENGTFRIRSDDEPPSIRRDAESRTLQQPASRSIDARGALASPSPTASLDPAADVYAEWDSQQTIDAVANALSALGEVVRLEATADFPERLRAERPDIVFNIAEGLHGTNRESHVPAICEFFGVPYSGSDPFTLSLCLHKARTKEMLTVNGVTTAPFALVESEAEAARLAADIGAFGLQWPLFAKPVHEGSSKGITERNFVRDRRELLEQTAFLLATYRQPVLVEQFLPGAEFTCGVLGNGNTAEMLPIVGMNFGSLPPGAVPIYGFEAKWVWDTPDKPLEIFECPARVPTALAQAIERVVLKAYRVLGCRDWSRIDVRLDAAGAPHVVEVNPLPGILPNPEDNSCLPKAARAVGMGYDELIQTCLEHAARRTGVRLREREKPRAAGRPQAARSKPLSRTVA